jgi:hypothetical protein
VYDTFGIAYQGRFFDVMFTRGGTNDIKYHAKSHTESWTDEVFSLIETRLEVYSQVIAKRVVYFGAGIPGRDINMDTFGSLNHKLGGQFPVPRTAATIDSEVDRGLARIRQRVIEKQAGNVWQTDSGVCFFQLYFPGQGG